jgi:hypothetical protein
MGRGPYASAVIALTVTTSAISSPLKFGSNAPRATRAKHLSLRVFILLLVLLVGFIACCGFISLSVWHRGLGWASHQVESLVSPVPGAIAVTADAGHVSRQGYVSAPHLSVP